MILVAYYINLEQCSPEQLAYASKLPRTWREIQDYSAKSNTMRYPILYIYYINNFLVANELGIPEEIKSPAFAAYLKISARNTVEDSRKIQKKNSNIIRIQYNKDRGASY